MSNAALTVRLVLALGEVEQSKLSAVSGWQKLAGNQGQKTDPWPGLLTGKAESEAEVGDEATDADALNEASLFPLPYLAELVHPLPFSAESRLLFSFPLSLPFSVCLTTNPFLYSRLSSLSPSLPLTLPLSLSSFRISVSPHIYLWYRFARPAPSDLSALAHSKHSSNLKSFSSRSLSFKPLLMGSFPDYTTIYLYSRS